MLNRLALTKGGPFTRVDPGDPTKKSCRDYAIVSDELLPYIDEVIIDSQKTFTPKRIINNGKDVSTDHFSFIIHFKDLPVANKSSKKEEVIIWNTKKSGGWKMYKDLMENCSELDEIYDDQNMNTTEVFDKIMKVQEKINAKDIRVEHAQFDRKSYDHVMKEF